MDAAQVDGYAAEMIRLADAAALGECPTSRDAGFDLDAAYAVARAALVQREQAGWRRTGRKIGFTNRTIYDEYGVYEPIFGYMYDQTVYGAQTAPAEATFTINLAGLTQPRIEPEIAFRLRARPPLTDDPAALLACVDWMAHGFEIVQCHFADWRFKVADTVADGGLHGAYVVGPRMPVPADQIDRLAEQLATFRISLARNGTPSAEGGGDLVLGSPLNALAHLIGLLGRLPGHPPLEPGEIVTTGTLTAALPVAPGETWSTRFEGLPLPGFSVRFA